MHAQKQKCQEGKFVIGWKIFYISGWFGEYRLEGNRKHLDFLYQAGFGSKNSQEFGMYEIKKSV